jgi:hypothetical protein
MMEQLSLRIRGILSEDLLGIYSKLVGYKKGMLQIVLFCDYSDFDIPIGYTFSQIVDLRNGSKTSSMIQLKGVSQQFGFVFDSVPKGHKTICNFEFIQSPMPEIIKSLPRISNWHESKNILLFT